MQFYYVQGKESPHSHWVHYGLTEKKLEEPAQASEGEFEIAGIEKVQGLFGFSAKNTNAESIKKHLSKRSKREAAPSLKAEGFRPEHYELRQKLTCPYDGYAFFPEGDIIEDIKLMQKNSLSEESSIIEIGFAKSIPFGVSKDLKQFGYDLFIIPEEENQKEQSEIAAKSGESLTSLGLLTAALAPSSRSLTFSPELSTTQTTVVPVGPDYIIGPGDTIVVNIWGGVQEIFPVEVDREGKIMLPKAGPLYLWGVKLKDAEKRIKQRLDQFYTNFNMDISMGKLRSIQIYVMGEVKKPGSYIIDSQSTIFQALYAAGGPTKLGSLRKIKIIHINGKEDKVDLYPFLLEGKKIGHSDIQSGDTIFIPAIGDVVAIAGSIKRPAIYETKSDIPLSDLVSFAGGITPTGDLQVLQVERVRNNERRVMLDMELRRSDTGEFSLKGIDMRNGDFVIISPIVRLKHDFVSVLGNVERPGDYALSKDMKVSDLVKRAKGFLPATYLHRAEIARVTEDRTRQIIPVDLDKMILGEKEEDIVLDEWDILLIYSAFEVSPPSFVEIDGAVNRPGKYELTPHMKVSDLMFKAGGLKPGGVIRGAE